MISSMTGFSRYELIEKGFHVVVEVRSLNNRFLDIFVRIPHRFSELENKLKNIIQNQICRGKIDVTIIINSLDEPIERVSVNLPLARQYFEAFRTLEERLGVPISIKPEDLLKIENLFDHSVPEEQFIFVDKLIQKTLKGALRELKKHRSEEGRNLAVDFRQRLNAVSNLLKIIRKIFKIRHKDDFNQLKNRISKVLEDVDRIDPQRLETEAAIMAEKFDISEEIVRIDSHLKMFRKSLSSNSSVGRRLDFILQEIYREVNTISAKSNNVLISQEVVRMKEEIDRLREQVRNIE
ncbi:hypothetical protein AMJ80_02945 [bacterium SM23_31]|nr:MAG: hypothetical protein AMJ80_02945 [bacterium SM23_31]